VLHTSLGRAARLSTRGDRPACPPFPTAAAGQLSRCPNSSSAPHYSALWRLSAITEPARCPASDCLPLQGRRDAQPFTRTRISAAVTQGGERD